MPAKMAFCPSLDPTSRTGQFQPNNAAFSAAKTWSKGPCPYQNGFTISSYAVNTGLMAPFWASFGLPAGSYDPAPFIPWYRPGPYDSYGDYVTGNMPMWRASDCQPRWPVLADLRHDGSLGDGANQGPSSNHNTAGYNILYVDNSAI